MKKLLTLLIMLLPFCFNAEAAPAQPYRGAVAHYIDSHEVHANLFNMAENDGYVTVNCVTYEGDTVLANLDVEIRVTTPSGESYWIVARDDGEFPDIIPRDGIYAGIFHCDKKGHYMVTSTAKNFRGQAIPILRHPPFYGPYRTEPFQRMAQIAFDAYDDPATARKK